MPPATPSLEIPAPPTLEDGSCWGDWRRTQSENSYACAFEAYQAALTQAPNVALNHFRFGVLNWEQGDKNTGRREIIQAVRLDVFNEEFLEYLFGRVIPPPAQLEIQNGLPLYTEKFDSPYLIEQAQNVDWVELTEVHTPSNVADGASAIQLTWQKPGMSWASFIIGFDPDLANREKAQTGGLVSLGGLNRFNLEEYALTFWVKSEGIQGADQYNDQPDTILRIKLQDQNLAVQESIGNQALYSIEMTENWKQHTIPFDKFQIGEWWIHQSVCSSQVDVYECHRGSLLQFDWSRVKQINFDLPFFSTTGKIFLDDIRIIRLP